MRFQDRREAGRALADRLTAATVQALRAALRDDLDTATALDALDSWAAGGSSARSKDVTEGPGDVAAAVDALFGITLRG